MEKSKELEERVNELEKQNDEVNSTTHLVLCVHFYTVKQKSQNTGK